MIVMGETILKELREAVLDFDDDGARRLAAEAVAAGMDPVMVLEEGLAKALREVGASFGRGATLQLLRWRGALVHLLLRRWR